MANKILEGAQDTIESLTSSLNETAKTYLSLEKIIPRVIDLFVDQADDVRMLNKELGSGSKLAFNFRKEILQVSTALGISSRETLRLVEATKEYHQGVTDVTKATLNFQKATGVSIGILGKLTAKINILGNISKEANEQMYTNILSVREAYGLTDNQIEDIIVTLTNYAVATQASDEQIVKASTSLSKFTSLLTSAGIEADRVSEILNGMLDPDRMLDNVVLLNKIGISVNDMVSGNPTEKLEGSVYKLKELGQEIANIAKTNRLQASELAKVYNLTLQEAIQLSELDTSEKALNTQKKLEEYRNETASLVESLKSFKEMVVGYIAQGINSVLGGFEKLEGSLGLFKKGLVALGGLLVGKFVLGKLKDGVMSLFGKAAKTFGTTVSEYLIKVEEKLKNKNADIVSLSPKTLKNDKINYGWGRNYYVAAEERRNEYVRKHFGSKLKSDLTSGEILETVQSRMNAKNEMEKRKAYMSPRELQAYEEKYGARFRLLDEKFKNLTDLLESENRKIWTESQGGRITDIVKSSEAGTSSAFDLYKETLNNAKINTGILGNLKIGTKESDALGKVFLESSSGGPMEFLKAMEEFWKNSKDPEAPKNLELVVAEQKKYNDNLLKQVEAQGKATEIIKEYDEAISEGSKGLKGRFASLFKGFGLNIGTKLQSLISSAPSKLFGLLKKTFKFGLLGLAGGVGVKFMASLSKNEKFQEKMSEITEKVSTIFDGIVKSVEPVIEPLANAVMGIFNLLQPAINWLSNLLGKIAGWFGGVLNKSVSSISKNVTTISDSYKQEDLKTMVAATSLDYNRNTDSLTVKLGDVVNIIEGISKKIDEGNLLTMTAGNQSK